MRPVGRPPLSLFLALLAGLLGAAAGLAPSPCRAGDDLTYDNWLRQAQGQIREAERRAASDPAAGRAIAADALRLLEEADRLKPTSLDVPFLAVVGSVTAQDSQAASSWLDRYARRDTRGDRSPDIHFLRGLVALRLRGQPDEAIQEFLRMQALNPGVRADLRDMLYDEALRAQAQRLATGEEYQKSIDLLRDAVRLARRRGDRRGELAARGSIGIVLQLEQRWIEAGEVFQDLRKDDPTNPLWAWRIGVNLASQFHWVEAIPYYEEALKIQQASGRPLSDVAEMDEIYLRVANCRRNVAAQTTDPAERQRLIDEAKKGFDKHLELHPKSVPGHYWLGVMLFEQMDKPYEALVEFQKAYALDPVCDHSLRTMLQIHMQKPPPPGTTPEAWAAEKAALQKDLEDHAADREKERTAREHGPQKDAGCE